MPIIAFGATGLYYWVFYGVFVARNVFVNSTVQYDWPAYYYYGFTALFLVRISCSEDFLWAKSGFKFL